MLNSHLHIEVISRISWESAKDTGRLLLITIDKIIDAKNHLHHAVQVTRITQILHSRIAGSADWLQLARALRQNAPLTDALVHVDLQLDHRFLSLFQLIGFNAEVGQMLDEIRIEHHVVLGVAVDVALAVGRDCAQFHSQRVLYFGVVFYLQILFNVNTDAVADSASV